MDLGATATSSGANPPKVKLSLCTASSKEDKKSVRPKHYLSQRQRNQKLPIVTITGNEVESKNMQEKQLKQMMLKEFMTISKNKPKENPDEHELEEKAAFNKWTQDPNDISRPATMREMFHLNLHMKKYIYLAIKKTTKNR